MNKYIFFLFIIPFNVYSKVSYDHLMTDKLEYNYIKTDFDNDGILDSMFSSKKIISNELYIFLNKTKKHELIYSGTNFSEDGGPQVETISCQKKYCSLNLIGDSYDNSKLTIRFGVNKKKVYVYKLISYSKNPYRDYTKIKKCIFKSKQLMTSLENNNIWEMPQENGTCEDIYIFEDQLMDFLDRFGEKNIYILNGIPRYVELLKKFPINNNSIYVYNNIAYYLMKNKLLDESIFLLKKIIKISPKRTVAYLNIGDSYWLKGMKSKAIINYNIYIKLMTKEKLNSKIPNRILDRIK